MFRMPSLPRPDARHHTLPLAATLLLLLVSGPALAGPVAKSLGSIHIHAGPAVEYPQVTHLPANTRFQVQGCLPDFGWCDVSTGRYRGWVQGSTLSIDLDGTYRPVEVIGPAIGVPVVHFSIGPYWSTHYANQPWLDDPRYAAEIHAYRVQSRVGNTVIEVERQWQTTPRYRHLPPPPAYYPPPVYVVPAPGYRPPRPIYGPGPYEPPIFIPPSQRIRPGVHYPPQYHPAPVYPSPGTIHQPPAFRPAPTPYPSSPGTLPGHQPDGRAIPPGAIIQNHTAPAGGSRLLK
ncbi:MAG: hypothetical protein Q4E06_00405 [Lautropia sp.]|nr:hypothetical protein [Lautropia sp.]